MEFLLIWLLFGIATAVVASNKGKGGIAWFILGCLLGPFGLIFALVAGADQQRLESEALSTGRMRKCPECAELVRSEARKCRFCGTVLVDPEFSKQYGRWIDYREAEESNSRELSGDSFLENDTNSVWKRLAIYSICFVMPLLVLLYLTLVNIPSEISQLKSHYDAAVDEAMADAEADLDLEDIGSEVSSGETRIDADRPLIRPNGNSVDFGRTLSPDAEVLADDLQTLGLSETEARAFATYCDQNRVDPMCQ